MRALNRGESLLVNSLDGTGISELRSSILEIAETTRGFREPLPRKWVNLREKIREITRTRKYVTFEDYKKVACVECEIQVDQLLSVTSFLHETLELRYFGISDMRQIKIDFEDFITLTLGTGKKDLEARAFFDKLDVDHSNTIDSHELEIFARAHGLNSIDIKSLMQSANDDNGTINFEEFRTRFEMVKSAGKRNVLVEIVYLDMGWMIDVIKGIVRHSHAALFQYLQNGKQLGLLHQARRLRVQGIISDDLIRNNLLWPGKPSPFWSAVAEVDCKDYVYERELWNDGAQGLKKVVETEDDQEVALGLLQGFKIILPQSADRMEFFCPDLVPPHKMNTVESVSFKQVSCEYFLMLTYSQLPFGFWTTLFMEIRSVSTSGSTSTFIQAFFLLSAKIQIVLTKDKEENFRIEVRASNRSSFEVAKKSFSKVCRFYREMALWEVSRQEISLEASAKIIEPAQVLIMTATPLVRKNADIMKSFNDTAAKLDSQLHTVT